MTIGAGELLLIVVLVPVAIGLGGAAIARSTRLVRFLRERRRRRRLRAAARSATEPTSEA